MALVFPSSSVKAEYIRHGAGDFYIGTYVAAGADAATIRHMGPTLGGLSFDPKRTMHPIEVDQFLGSIASFPTKEDFIVKVTLLDTTLANVYKALAYATNTLTAGDRTDNAGSMGLGEESREVYYQLLWKGNPPSQSSAAASIIQLYKCAFEAVAEIKFEKPKETGIQITFRALTDPSITTANKVGKWLEQ
jgi:hypothetical protein